MGFILAIFWNRRERRLRALYRILLQAVLIVIIVFPFAALFPSVRAPLSPAGLAVQSLAVVIAIVLAAKLLDRRRLSDFGVLPNRVFVADCAFGMVLGGVAMSLIFGGLWLAGWLSVTEIAFTAEDAAWPFAAGLAGLFIATILVGFYEELFSRGYQMRNLAEGLHGWIIGPRTALVLALVLTSLLFSGFHLNNPNSNYLSATLIAFAGVLLGLPVVLTGNLGIAVGLHITWNFFQGGIFGFGVSGHQLPVALFKTELTGPEIWTGGVFGPEAGLSGLCAMIFCALAILAWVRWRYGQLAIYAAYAEYVRSADAETEPGPPAGEMVEEPEMIEEPPR